MRPVAAILALSAALLQLTAFLLAEDQVAVLGGGVGAEVVAGTGAAGLVAGPVWPRAVMLAGSAVPWLVGGVLLATSSSRLGTAVVVAATVLALPAGGGSGQAVLDVAGDGSPLSWAGWGQPLVALCAWTAGTASGAVALAGRRRGNWRDAAPGVGGTYTTLAVLAWLPTLFTTAAFAPPGAPRRFVELPPSEGLGLGLLGLYGAPVVAGLVLWVAPRLRREVAGVVVLSFALPLVAGQAGTAWLVATQPGWIATPPAVLGLAGAAGLIAIGTAWLVSGAARGRATGRASAPPERGPR